MDLAYYYNQFGVDEKIIHDIMSLAMSRGGDYCDLFFQHSIGNHIRLQDKAVNSASHRAVLGVGIRVLKGDQTGYSFTDEMMPEAMKLAAKTAANIADSGKKTEPAQVKLHKIPNYYPIETSWEDVSIDQKIPFLEQINDKVFAQDNRVIKCNISFSDATAYILIATSEGRIVHDYKPMVQISVSCTAEQKGRREQNYLNLSGRNGIEFLTPEIVDRLAKEPVRRTVALFDAVKPDAGEMEVVLAAGRSGILLHEAIGHGMEADFNRKAVSIFSDKMNTPIAEKFVTIVDDGTNPNVRGSVNVDDEGNDTEKTYLVEEGVLRNYLHDRISARHYKVKPTGNGRRQSFRFAPIPRMRNTYMLPGPHKKEEIIRSVKKGLYAETFTNGEVLIGAGDFTFYVKSGYLIEDGRLTRPVKDVNIIGNGPEVLRNIVMVGDDLKMAEAGGTCGKEGQRVPVSLGQPTVKVSRMTVGGISSS
ncbi:TldD/PmbA family protein [Desulfonema magnum]|uniref:Modulator of DNA gyrase n=1 Tax=Desulfonema magnum TaxID=45655 RepID=A0A975BJP1_9BACT|nr:TldD/PmbA family protein [Desulfonema magnum]QTA86656.1 Putative modulator of DNA gyrase [Desulfonema magnum]